MEASRAAGRKPFAAFIQEQRRGAAHDELSEELQKLVAAVVETAKKGTLTLKVDVAMGKDGRTLLIADTVTVKLPKHDSKPSLFFFDERGNLSRENPAQTELPLKKLEGGKGGDNQADEASEAVGQ